MKGRSKRLLALLLAAGMLATQIPASPLLVQAETNSDVDAGSEEMSDLTVEDQQSETEELQNDETESETEELQNDETESETEEAEPASEDSETAELSDTGSISDSTIVATTDTLYADQHDDQCLDRSENEELFDLIAQQLNKTGETINITYGEVKGMTSFVIPEDSSVEYLYGISKILPNLTDLTVNCHVIYDWHAMQSRLTSLIVRQPNVSFSASDLSSETATSLRSLTIEASDVSIDRTDMSGLNSLQLRGFVERSWEAAVSGMTQLENLKISYNIEDSSWNTITQLSNLKTLDLSDNDRLTTLPAEVNNLTKLESLNVSRCGLKSISDITGMSSLKTLSMAENTELLKPEVLKKIPKLFAEDTEWVEANFGEVNEVVTTGDQVSQYYIPDQNLYAYLLKNADRDGDNVLSVKEALQCSSLYGTIGEVTDFTGLASVFRNLERVNFESEFQDKAVEKNCYEELSKLENLRDLTVYGIDQESFDLICNGKSKLTRLDYRYGTGDDDKVLSVSSIANQTELTDLSIFPKIKDVEALNKLTKLKTLSIMEIDNASYASIKTVLAKVEELEIFDVTQECLDVLSDLDQLTRLKVWDYTNSDSMKKADFSKLKNLTQLEFSAEVEQVILPEAGILEDLSIQKLNYQSSDKIHVKNLDKQSNLRFLYLCCTDVKNLDEISKLSELVSLSISYADLTDTKGIGKLTKLGYLGFERTKLTTISNEIENLTGLSQLSVRDNNNLTSIPDCLGNFTNLDRIAITDNKKLTNIGNSISKLTKVYELYLYNNALTSLPDLHGLCTEDGLVLSTLS